MRITIKERFKDRLAIEEANNLIAFCMQKEHCSDCPFLDPIHHYCKVSHPFKWERGAIKKK